MPRTRDVLIWVPAMVALAALVRMDAAAPQPAGTSALPDTAQVFRTAAATIRVSAIKALQGDPEGVAGLTKLMEALDSYIPLPQRCLLYTSDAADE